MDRHARDSLPIRQALVDAPALGLPNINKPFFLYVDELRGIAKGVITQELGTWQRPIAYLSQSSGQVERMNQTLKNMITKLALETGNNWVSLLPFALLWTQCTPYASGISPFEAMYGRLPPLIPKPSEEKLAELTNQISLIPCSLFSPS